MARAKTKRPKSTKKRPTQASPAPKSPKQRALSGGCGCGAVRFTVQGPLHAVTWCHCGRCQRFHGGPGPYTATPRGAVAFSRREGLTWWDASPTVQRGFCKHCGSSLFFSDSSDANLAIAAGVLDAPTGLRSSAHIFVGSKPDWYGLHDELREFDAFP